MVVSSIQLYDLLSDQLGKEKAKTLVTFVESKVDEGLKDKTSVFTTKEDIQILRVEMQTLFNKQLTWMIASIFSAAGIVITIISMLLHK